MKKPVRNPSAEAMALTWKAVSVVIILIAMVTAAIACEPEQQAKAYKKGAVDAIVYCVKNGKVEATDATVICVRGQKA